MVTNLYPYPGYPAYGNFIKGQIDSLEPEGVHSRVIFINGRESKLNYLRSPFDLWRILNREPYDLVHGYFGLGGLVARMQPRLPLVVSLIGDDLLGQPDRYGRNSPLGHFFQDSSRWLARHSDAVIVMSEEMRRLAEIPNAIIMGNGVDLELFKPMGRNEACDRVGLVDEAVRRARSRLPELEILTVFRSSHSELATLMNAADVFVLASYWEGAPNAVKEAMSVNLPIISAPVGDVPELFEGVSGCYLCEPEPEPLAARIIEVCSKPRDSRGREKVSSFTIELVARRLVNLYRRLLGRAEIDESAFPPRPCVQRKTKSTP